MIALLTILMLWLAVAALWAGFFALLMGIYFVMWTAQQACRWVAARFFVGVLCVLFALCGSSTRAQEIQTVAADAEPSADQIAVGLDLFFDKRLSTTNEKSCASCHDPDRGWSDPGPVSEGVSRAVRDRRGNVARNEKQFGTRRSMTIENAVFKADNFHDGRARMLEGQVTQPIQAAAEMGNQTLQQAFNRIARIPGYQEAFQKAFGRGVNVTDGIRAIAMFERTVVSGEAPIDRYARGETWVFDEQQERGRFIFYYENCDACHFGRNFTDGAFHDILGATRDRTGQLDTGRGKITGRRQDNFTFVTPTLRDVGKRAPYFHAGQAADMRALVDILCDPPRGSELPGMELNNDDRAALARFLETAFESYRPPYASTPALPQ